MTYRLKLKSSLQQSVHRVAKSQLQIGATALDDTTDPATAIHSTRKALKRLRALLQLVKSGLPDAEWKAANAHVRKIARSLSATRDRDVLRATLVRLRSGAQLPLLATLDQIEADIDAGVALTNGSPPVDISELSEDARNGLASLGKRLAKLSVGGNARHILFAGLVRTHKAGRRALLEISESVEPTEAYHDLRKAIQLHWRQMQLVRRVWPVMIDSRIAVARDLSQQIGEDHDLAVLAQRIAHLPDLPAEQLALVTEAIADAQKDLRKKALPEAQRLFLTKPRRFAGEIMSYWDHAQPAKAAKPADDAPLPEPKTNGSLAAHKSNLRKPVAKPDGHSPAQRRKSATASGSRNKSQREGSGLEAASRSKTTPDDRG